MQKSAQVLHRTLHRTIEALKSIMNTENSQADQDWLDALTGKPKPGMDPLQAAQALAVRHALKERREAIEADASQPDVAGLNAIRQRLQSERLMEKPSVKGIHAGLLVRVLGLFGLGGSGGSSVIPIWGVTAVLVIGVAVVLRMGMPNVNEDAPYDVLRGGTATVLIVDNPQAKLTELEVGLRAAKVRFETKLLNDNRVQVDIKADDPALAFLESQRISPTVKDGIVRIVIERPPVKN